MSIDVTAGDSPNRQEEPKECACQSHEGCHDQALHAMADGTHPCSEAPQYLSEELTSFLINLIRKQAEQCKR